MAKNTYYAANTASRGIVVASSYEAMLRRGIGDCVTIRAESISEATTKAKQMAAQVDDANARDGADPGHPLASRR